MEMVRALPIATALGTVMTMVMSMGRTTAVGMAMMAIGMVVATATVMVKAMAVALETTKEICALWHKHNRLQKYEL